VSGDVVPVRLHARPEGVAHGPKLTASDLIKNWSERAIAERPCGGSELRMLPRWSQSMTMTAQLGPRI
jgi:hypothetical protein